MKESLPEAWLRGPLDGVDPLIAPVLRSFQQAAEELAEHSRGLAPEQVWARPHGMTSLGFHLRHIAGSVDRLSAYVAGRQLSAAEMEAMRAEQQEPASPSDWPLEKLLEEVDRSFRRAEALVRAIDPASLRDARAVGRKQIPVTVAGLLVHIAEHTHRHLGEAISASKLARAAAPAS
ncbi:MAG: DinB family protein [Bryobacterales bacterium]|nr:DinB family protein [Bryobacterales bacterium]